MPKTLNLKLDMNSFEELHVIYDKARPSTIMVSVPRASLNMLMRDHTKMLEVTTGVMVIQRQLEELNFPKAISNSQFEKLIESKRKNSAKVSIDKRDLIWLLTDYSHLYGMMEDIGITIKEG